VEDWSWPFVLLGACGLVACGADVDVGGVSDASASADTSVEAGVGAECDPCTASSDCAAGLICGQFAGDTYCARLCQSHDECTPDETCISVTAAGTSTQGCVPTSGVCGAPPAPTDADGGMLSRCGVLSGPSVPALCHSCGRYSNDCQPNGCYGGWWCNTSTRWCQRPPTSCP
jgi:hypothetical protein